MSPPTPSQMAVTAVVRRTVLVLGAALALVVPGSHASAQEPYDDDPAEDDDSGEADGYTYDAADDEGYGDIEGEAGDDSAGGLVDQRLHDAIRIDAHFMVGYYHELGIGFRVDIPLAREGLIDGIDDDVSLSLGAELLWFYHDPHSGFGTYPIAAAQWNFYLTEKWSVFAEIGVSFVFAPYRQRYWRTFLAPMAALGGRYHFSARNALFFRIGWMPGPQIGVTF